VFNRRSFFTRIYKAAAIIALAPQLAFRCPKLSLEFLPWQDHFSNVMDELLLTAKHNIIITELLLLAKQDVLSQNPK